MQGRGEQVRHWFEKAVDVPIDGRVAFLEANCADAGVRTEVISLLSFDGDDSYCEPQVALPNIYVQEAIDAAFGQAPAPGAPVQRVGPFELGRLLGSGGMGFVYEAHRTDGQVRQRVAVKFVISTTGEVMTAQDGGSDLPDNAVVQCIVRGFQNLSFPQPESGVVTVVYPIIFNPGD